MKDTAIFALKGVAIIGVVFHHIGNRRFDGSVIESINILPATFSWCVLAFIAASGWLHSISEEKRVKSMDLFFRSRARRLLLPFVALVILYSLFWQAIQLSHIPGLREEVPRSFIAKIWASMPMTDAGRPVAEQLYFFPLLFIICIVTHCILRLFGSWGLAALYASSFVIGLMAYPQCSNTGFSTGVGIWGMTCYSSAFLMYRYRHHKTRILLTTIVMMLIVIVAIGGVGLAKILPIMFLSVMRDIPFDSFPLLQKIGEASGTTFAYHSPVLLQPMVIAATFLPSHGLQITGAILAALVAIAVCTKAFYKLKTTAIGFAIL